MSNTISISSNLLEERIKKSGKTKKAICSEIGISPITLRRWLNGSVTEVRHDNLQKISLCLNCRDDDLIEQDNLSLSAEEQSLAVNSLDQNEFYSSFIRDGWQLGATVMKTMFRADLNTKARIQLYFWMSIYRFLIGKTKDAKDIADKVTNLSKNRDITTEEEIQLHACIHSRELNPACVPGFEYVISESKDPIKRVMSSYMLMEWYQVTGNFDKGRIAAFKGKSILDDLSNPFLKTAYNGAFELLLSFFDTFEGNYSKAAYHLELASKSVNKVHWGRGKIAVRIFQTLLTAHLGGEVSEQIRKGFASIPEKDGFKAGLQGFCLRSARVIKDYALVEELYRKIKPTENLSLDLYIQAEYALTLSEMGKVEQFAELAEYLIAEQKKANPDVENNFFIKTILNEKERWQAKDEFSAS